MSQLFLSTVEAVSGHEYKPSYLMSIFLLSVECKSSFPVKHISLCFVFCSENAISDLGQRNLLM